MNRLLAIETSSEVCSVALSIDGEIIQRHAHAPLKHAELLLPSVRGLLAEADVSLNSLSAIVFGRGPGSFTSLRIGIGVVQGLAWGAELPVVPVSSLAAVAQQANAEGAEQIWVAMDARMSEVFQCRYRRDQAGLLVPVGEETVSPPDDLLQQSFNKVVGVGNGFERYRQLAELNSSLLRVQAELLPAAAALIPLAGDWLHHHAPLPASAAQPIYVRNNVAEKPSKT